MNLSLSLVAKILLAGLLLTLLWFQILRIMIWAVRRLMEWGEDGGERERILRLLWRILLGPL